jgi:hypothetical protein
MPVLTVASVRLIKLVLHGLPERLHPTWRLIALSFAREATDMDLNSYHGSIMEDLGSVGPVEQLVWIDYFFKDPVGYRFLTAALSGIIKFDQRLQEHVLSRTPYDRFPRGTPQHLLILGAIPLNLRLRVARLAFLQNKLLGVFALDIYREAVRRNMVYTEFYGKTLSAGDLVRLVLIGMQRKHMHYVQHPFMPDEPATCVLQLVGSQKMARLGFALATASLFGIDTGFPLSQAQLQLLLRTYWYLESEIPGLVHSVFQVIGDVDGMNYHDGLAVERVRAAQRMAVQVLPPYLEWFELPISRQCR